ncbi:AAA family ATPase [Arthrobacter globiformis]|uniref:AAA family ATPase n=1 Tax=Arthrobacter globiformis TaxID=1665 RepID=UPI0027D77239|nr:AAA family ATPase [Arthrobacter globiformis]
MLEGLNRGADSALTLVSAPAGFGKTTLLTEWLATVSADGRSAAWLSLDKRDNDSALFWTYFVTALERVTNGAGAAALSLLQSVQPPIEALLATLLNDLHAVSNNVVLVLDDYHVIDARDIQDGIAFLLEHLPPQVHLVIAGRADPVLPLARLRARGELVEIRAADLRFTTDEAAEYLNGILGTALPARDVAVLEGRTEGVDRGAPARCAFNAGPGRHRRVHRGLCRERPIHRGLFGRGGSAASTGGCSTLPAPDFRP